MALQSVPNRFGRMPDSAFFCRDIRDLKNVLEKLVELAFPDKRGGMAGLAGKNEQESGI